MAMVGVSLYMDNRTVEFWLPITIEPITGEPLEAYLTALPLQWQERIRQIAPSIAPSFDRTPVRHGFRMRSRNNMPRVWFTAEELALSGHDEPLAEIPVPKDRWITEDAEVISYRPMPGEFAPNSARVSFGRELQAHNSDPEVAGGHIARVVAADNNPVQT
jgi:hypothetical protein